MAGTERFALPSLIGFGGIEGRASLLQPPTRLREGEREFAADTRQAIGVLQRGIPTVLGERRGLPEEFRNTLFTLTFSLPPAPAEMTESFTTLKDELRRPWENGDKTDTLFSRTMRAYLIAGTILYQSALPAEERQMYVHFSDPLWRRGIREMVKFAHGVFSPDARSLDARAALTGEMDSYVRFVEAQSKRDATTPEQTLSQAVHVNTLIESEQVDGSMYYLIDPKAKDKLSEIHKTMSESIAQNPLSTQLLLDHQYDDFHAEIKGETFVQTMWRELDNSDGPDSSTVGQLHEFYFGDAPLRGYYWRRLNKTVKHHEKITDLFLNADTATARRFVEVSMADVTTDPDGTAREDKKNRIQKLLGIVADFQGRNPEHENLSTILDATEQAGQSVDAQQIVQPVVSILKGDSSGFIYLNENEEACTKNLRHGEDLEKLGKRMEALNPQYRIAYVSARQDNVIVSASQTTSGAVVVRERPITSATSPAENVIPERVFLAIREGELAIDSRWPDAQYLSSDQIGHLGDHLNSRLGFGDREEGDWLAYVSNAQLGRDSFSPDFPAVFPSLLPDGHRFNILNQLGIQCVESTNGLITVVFDTFRAGIQTDGPRRLLLRGRLDNDGNFVVNGDDNDAFDIHTQLVITGSALFAQQYIAPTYELGEEELARVKDTVRVYNRDHMGTGMPRIVTPRTAGEQHVPHSNTSVLVSTGRKKDMIPLPLEFPKKS